MTIVTVWFLPKKIEQQERWINLLREWLFRARKACPNVPRYVILESGDNESEIIVLSLARDYGAGVIKGVPGRFGLEEYPGREGDFTRKVELICGVLPDLPKNTLYLDSDAWLANDPSEYLFRCDWSMAMAPCASPVMIPNSAGDVEMRSAGVMWFGGVESRKQIVEDFCRAFRSEHNRKLFCEFKTQRQATGQGLAFYEQGCWSAVNQKQGGHLLIREMNWCPFLQSYGENNEAYVNHWHGKWKWHKLGYTDEESVPRILKP